VKIASHSAQATTWALPFFAAEQGPTADKVRVQSTLFNIHHLIDAPG
jgi:hypothetical protein